MTPSPQLHIRPFEPRDQAAARRVILEGLRQHHLDEFDETRNPDLDDITATYVDAGHLFVVADVAGQVVGTGALKAEGERTGRIERVSVAQEYRRRGFARAIVAHLLEAARQRGYTKVLVETNHDWGDAVGLWKRCGFTEYSRDDVSVHLSLTMRGGYESLCKPRLNEQLRNGRRGRCC